MIIPTDHRPDAAPRADATMLAEVRAGLQAVQKKLPSKYLYDGRGMKLFEQITRLPEFYLARAEHAILAAWASALVARTGARTLVELGARTGPKAAAALLAAIRRQHRHVTHIPIADPAGPFALPRGLPAPVLVALLGSTIGNFHSAAAVKLLRRVHAQLRPGDHLLLGADLRKDHQRLVAAYNDASGVTAAFNRNILDVMNRRLGADFDPRAFTHRAFYNRTARRIEMHLVSAAPQAVAIPGVGVVELQEGETIRTAIGCKYDRQAICDLFSDAGFRLEEWRTDDAGDFALALGAR